MSSVGGIRIPFDDRGFTPTLPQTLPPVGHKVPSPTNGKTKAEVFSRPDMPESVLDGRLGEIYQRRMKRWPRAYAWLTLVTVGGTLIPRANRPLRSNLYACPVGPVESGKSTAADAAARFLGLRSPELLEAKFGSAEGLAAALEGTEPEPVRLLQVDELAHLLEKSKIDRSSFPMVLNTAYYHDHQKGGSKGHQYELNCRLSVVGGIVEELFGDSFGVATTGGLYDRFVFGLCPQPYCHLWRPIEGEAEPIHPQPALVDPDVWDVRDEWVKKYQILPRVAEHALRVAYICASVDLRPSLRAVDLGPALAFAQYQMRVRRVLAPNPGENPDARCGIAVRAWLADHAPDGRWVKRRAVDKGIHAYRFGAGVFVRCLNYLSFNREIELRAEGGELRLLTETESSEDL